MSTKDVTKTFAEFVSKTQFSDLPEEVVEQSKDYILDSIGCTLGSYGVPEGVLIAKMEENSEVGWMVPYCRMARRHPLLPRPMSIASFVISSMRMKLFTTTTISVACHFFQLCTRLRKPGLVARI